MRGIVELRCYCIGSGGFFYILENNVPKKCWLANGFQIPTFPWIYGAIDWKVHYHFTPHLERENVAN